MESQLNLIQDLRLEINQIKKDLEEAKKNYDESIDKSENISQEIKILEAKIEKVKAEQLPMIIRTGAFVILIEIIALIFNLDIVAFIIVLASSCIACPTIFPKYKQFVYNFLMRLSPKLRETDNLLSSLKKEIKEKVEHRAEIETESQYLFIAVESVEQLLKDKTIELEMLEEVYFSNLFANTNNENNVTVQKTNKVKTRSKIKKKDD